MPITITEKSAQVTVSIGYRIEQDGYAPFQDTLHFTKAEFDALSKVQIRAVMQERYSAWKTSIAPPSPLTELESLTQILAEQQAQVAGLQQAIAQTQARILELSSD